jgi:large subunit ribosomal protein L22
MTGLKTNERPGTRASVKYIRGSAYKAREVLDQIRGKSYGDAAEILAFSERSISEPIMKVLDSAVANAEHNDSLDAEELYVSACYADEGPTLKRWRPRARGRATRIRKRTCHITVIVSRYDDDELEARREREANRGRSSSAQASEARRRRVAQSRAREEEEAHEHDEAEDDSAAGEAAEVEEKTVEEQAAEVMAATTGAMAEEPGTDDAEDESTPQILEWDDSVPAPADGSIPDGYPVKGNVDSMKYHEPGGRWYDQTEAEVYFTTAEAAEAAGFTKAGSRKKKDD